MNTNIKHNDEIDFSKVFRILLKGKVKFFIIMLISFILAFIINRNLPAPTVISSTEITPLIRSDLNNFEVFNSLGVFDINPVGLYNDFLHLLKERVAVKSAIRKFKIVTKENYKDDEAYERAVSIESYKMKLVDLKIDNSKDFKIYSLNLKGTDKDKLLKIIKYIKNENNRLNILKLENDFNSKVNSIKLKDKIKKITILDQIQDKKKEFDLRLEKSLQKLQFEIEDNKVAIENSVIEYELKTKRRIQYLREQASIARKLQIPNLTTNIRTNSETTDVFGIAFNLPFYLIGYEAIEKEIEILENRKEIKNFADNEKLVKKRRQMLQDKTLERKDQNMIYDEEILFLQNQLRILSKNERLILTAQKLFQTGLSSNSKSFESINFELYSTIFTVKPAINFFQLIILTIFFGIIASLSYLIIEEKLKQ